MDNFLFITRGGADLYNGIYTLRDKFPFEPWAHPNNQSPTVTTYCVSKTDSYCNQRLLNVDDQLSEALFVGAKFIDDQVTNLLP